MRIIEIARGVLYLIGFCSIWTVIHTEVKELQMIYLLCLCGSFYVAGKTDTERYMGSIYIDALHHIAKVANESRTKTNRILWIEERAKSAINNTEDWRLIKYPKKRKWDEVE